ncbi:MAG: hypothetical protein HY303_00830 [Candidatus Wallbacteria bacterium]|nr:hypothetical protein [Candidatus Wallbacteria bacterium]
MLAPTAWSRHRLEAALGTLLAARVEIGQSSYEFPWGLVAQRVTVSVGGTPVATVAVAKATPAFWTLAGRPLRLTSLHLADGSFDAGALPCLAALASQPADRLPATVVLTATQVRTPERDEPIASGLELTMLGLPSGLRELRAQVRALGAPWRVTGRLSPGAGAAMRLEAEASSPGPLELPLPARKVRVEGEAKLSLQGRIEDRVLAGYYGRLELPHARLGHAGARWSASVPGLVLACEDGRLRLDETAFDFGGTKVRVRGALEVSGRGELTLASDLCGLEFPKPPRPGEAALSWSVSLAGGWPAPHLKAGVRLLGGKLGRGVSTLETQVEADLDLVDMKLTGARIGGLVNARPFTVHGSVTVPPWEPGNPLLLATVELPRLDAEVASLMGPARELVWNMQELGFRGQVRGPLNALSATGELRAVRGSLLGLQKASASVKWKPPAAGAMPVLEVSEVAGESEGRHWKSAAAFTVSLAGRPILVTPVELRSQAGSRRVAAGTALAP